MLIGGLAVAAWGEPRATVDVDLTVWAEPAELDQAVTRLCQRLRCLPPEPAEFARRARVLPAMTVQGIRVDFIFGALPVERDAIGRAQTKEIGGRPVRVAAVEDLILMKAVSERDKDLEDVRRLVRRYKDSFDRAYLEPRLKELAEALGKPGLAREVGL
jgi:hypothetical protein